LLRVKRAARIWVCAEQGARCTSGEARRERRYYHPFYLEWIHLAASVLAPREDLQNSTNHIIESLKTFP
jgi:hypothetical protein